MRQTKTQASYEHLALRKDGSIFPVEVRRKTLPYPGRLVNVTAIRDITERKQAEEALRQYAGRLQMLHEIDQAILAAQAPQAIAQTTLRYLRQLLSCRRAGVILFDFAANEMMLLALDLDGETDFEVGTRLPLEPFAPILEVGRQARLFVPLDIQSLPELVAGLSMEGIHSGIALPLIAREELMGSVNLWAAGSDPFPEEQLAIARQIADQLTIALQQARLFEAETLRRQEAEALYDIAAAFNTTLELDDLLDRILANIERVAPHDAANIMLIESGVARIVRSRGYDKYDLQETVQSLRFPLADTANLRRIAESGRPVIISDTRADPDWVNSWVRSYLGAPIRFEGRVIGFLNLDSASPNFFTPAQAERLQAFTNPAGLAINNAWL
jgi:GAF domain-containing protein